MNNLAKTVQELNILAGGPVDQWPAGLFSKKGPWIGADRGAYYLLKKGITPALVVGDFDSLSSEEFDFVQSKIQAAEIEQVPTRKDFTDTQLALRHAVEMPVDLINVYGATGGRIDHLLSNLWLPVEPDLQASAEKIRFIDCQNVVSYLLPGHKTVRKLAGMKYLGFMALGLVENLDIPDAEYPLTSKVNWPKMWSSNEFVGELVHVSFSSGILMVTQSKDGGL
ncbi:thiamine diphosphokinase [Eupransor demetentiae]|uniref:Thiamine diphosphokinase n=1 Tax=Eupransor demetentiae TaxID=3109584 RepID=A0ABP0ESY3_9LACO|nr:Thiamine pyrophosphokinase (ThiN) [Lactobacillaceae bacterium LMG 33000]